MQVVGVDFGTSNLRIATWDSSSSLSPEPKLVGDLEGVRTSTMPTAIAFERQPNGQVSIAVGEAADRLSESDQTDSIKVIRNIKRAALSSDSYVDWLLKVGNADKEDANEENQWPPDWWNPVSMSVEVWGQEFSVWDLIVKILSKAFERAGISGDYEWRAGCPVHANLEYRSGLTNALHQVTGKGDVNWIVEEPILFLLAARRLGGLRPEGSYLVYDVGGGSFDCALIEVAEGREMLTYGADGHPRLGGFDIDRKLYAKAKSKGFSGSLYDVRRAKENLTKEDRAYTLPDGTVVTLQEVEDSLKELRFREKSASVSRDAYVGAKMLWKRGEGDDYPSIGDVLYKNQTTGEVEFVWQLPWTGLSADVDDIILFGGPTKSHFFKEYLEKQFKTNKVRLAEEFDPADYDLAITGASIGACYSLEANLKPTEREHTPLYLHRLPVRVALQDLQTGDKVEYQPYEYLGSRDALTRVTIEDLQSGKKAKYDTYSRFAFRDGDVFDPFASKDSPVRATLKYFPTEGESEHRLNEHLGATGDLVRVTLTDTQTKEESEYVFTPAQRNPSDPFAPQDALLQLTLEELRTGRKAEYASAPARRNPFDVFVSRRSLPEQDDDPHNEGRYELTVETPTGLLVKTVDPDGVERERQPVGKPYSSNKPTINTRLIGSSLRLVIDLFGQVAIMQRSENSPANIFVVIENPPWQTEAQAQALQKQFEQDQNRKAAARIYGEHPAINENWREGLKEIH